MNVVGRVGSIVRQGIYTFAAPIQPFGGAVDIIVVEREDGTYRSTPWYVRFGKFQGVLKGAEKIVHFLVNDVEAGFHMYLDSTGEAYFVREVEAHEDYQASTSMDGEDQTPIEKTSGSEDAGVCDTPCLNGLPGDDDAEFPQDRYLEMSGNGYPTKVQASESMSSSFSVEYMDSFQYDSQAQADDAANSEPSDSEEVVLMSGDGRVMTAPITSSDYSDSVSIESPQFCLVSDEEVQMEYAQVNSFNRYNADLGSGNGEEASNSLTSKRELSQRTASADSTTLGIIFGSLSEEEGSRDVHGDGFPSSSTKVWGAPEETQELDLEETQNCDDTAPCIEYDRFGNPGDGDLLSGLNKEDIFKSCLTLPELALHTNEEEMEFQSPGNQNKEVAATIKDDRPILENDNREILLSASDSQCIDDGATAVNVEVEVSSKKVTICERANLEVSSVSMDGDVTKEEGLTMVSKPQEVEGGSGGECGDKLEPLQAEAESSSTGFEISLCGHLLHAGMGISSAAQAFDVHRVTEEQFRLSGASFVKNENLVIRVNGRYLPWDKAAPIILGMVAFGLEFSEEPTDAISVKENEAPSMKGDTPRASSVPSGRRWSLWSFSFRRAKSLEQVTSPSTEDASVPDAESSLHSTHEEQILMPNVDQVTPHKQILRTNTPTSEQIASLNLKEGQNRITFSFSTRVLGKQQVDAHIFLWKWNARIVISDVDGTITRSDVLGQVMPLVGRDWTQCGVARLFSAIQENGYQLMFLSARAISQAHVTRHFLRNLKQDGKVLPSGPMVISPDGLLPSLYREVIRRAPHEFKIACLEDIRALFPSDYNPFYAGFGNRETDEISYRKVGIPKGKIFIINPKGEVAINNRTGVKTYTSLHTLVHDMFPPTSLGEQEDYNSWNYWKMPLPSIE
ncbi:phosphatidate phosphatase PAH1 isoform X1 [Amborella trichopoda]|uniref:phosphatidate phosphatase n=1 Tax=Amborella trichopoda TaxID=13333 RepID=W1PWS1_AMBTC|nr:phosphatidate phosphatase PAH1 isoform X1 [Amborella trichopoda]ERN12236.1 hypothetical protein AMTR_s00034p00214670 [Amborella trichopoda]|eukprot:XP_006850655.1 phosphatidate phosphatase PAH1 isoform X1 [Amborella trichopoda]